MARSKCPSCESTRFELEDASIDGAQCKQFFVQCAKVWNSGGCPSSEGHRRSVNGHPEGNQRVEAGRGWPSGFVILVSRVSLFRANRGIASLRR